MTRAVIILASLAAMTAAPAGAAEFTFRLGQDALASDKAVAAAYDRLNREAADACGVDVARGVRMARAARACADEIADEVVAKIGDRALSARHAGRSEVRVSRR